MPAYKNEDIREFFSISRETVRRYATDFAEFFSAGATPEKPGTHRVYDESDLRVFGVIASMKNTNHSDDDIKATLRAGYDGEFSSFLKDESLSLSPHIQSKLANQHIDNLERQLSDAVTEAQTWRDKANQLEGQLNELRELLKGQVTNIELHKKIARLELLLEQAQNKSD